MLTPGSTSTDTSVYHVRIHRVKYVFDVEGQHELR